MLRLYIIGVSILIVAIGVNGLILKLGITSWYEFINLVTKEGASGLSKLNLLDYLWLFLGYPLVLGLAYWLGDKIYNLF